MRQQVNLYQAALIDKSEPLQFRQVGLILLVFVFLLVLLSGLGFWQMHGAELRLVELQKQQADKTAQILVLEQQYPERHKNALLEEEIERTKGLLDGQKQLLGYFSVREEGGNEEILQILEGLARHRQKGVWLRRIQLDGSGQKVALAGSARRPEQVPQYLQFLGEKGVLAGQVFSQLKLTRLKEHPGKVDFNLESLAGAQK